MALSLSMHKLSVAVLYTVNANDSNLTLSSEKDGETETDWMLSMKGMDCPSESYFPETLALFTT